MVVFLHHAPLGGSFLRLPSVGGTNGWGEDGGSRQGGRGNDDSGERCPGSGNGCGSRLFDVFAGLLRLFIDVQPKLRRRSPVGDETGDRWSVQ